MAEPVVSSPTRRIAVVTGGNKGIGFEICRQLASNGIMVILTARDEERGNEAVEKLKGEGFSDLVVFHQLDVCNPSSVASLAATIKALFGRLDILVNNAGISGSKMDWDALKASGATGVTDSGIKWDEVLYQNLELAQKCIETNYYGAQRMVEALIPLLQLSNSPRIVNVSSSFGQLKHIPNEWAKGILKDAENLSKEGIEDVVTKFLEDFKEGKLEINGWPASFSAYIVSKAALNAYTRVMAKNFPAFRINCVCPGYVSTDINNHTGVLTVEEGGASPVRLALLPDNGPSGLFFFRSEESSF